MFYSSFVVTFILSGSSIPEVSLNADIHFSRGRSVSISVAKARRNGVFYCVQCHFLTPFLHKNTRGDSADVNIIEHTCFLGQAKQ